MEGHTARTQHTWHRAHRVRRHERAVVVAQDEPPTRGLVPLRHAVHVELAEARVEGDHAEGVEAEAEAVRLHVVVALRRGHEVARVALTPVTHGVVPHVRPVLLVPRDLRGATGSGAMPGPCMRGG